MNTYLFNQFNCYLFDREVKYKMSFVQYLIKLFIKLHIVAFWFALLVPVILVEKIQFTQEQLDRAKEYLRYRAELVNDDIYGRFRDDLE